MSRERIIAIGLLTDADLKKLGPQFSRAYPIDEAPCFGELLHAIDEADRALWRQRDASVSSEAVSRSGPRMIITPRQ